jgi:hypothetical protein
VTLAVANPPASRPLPQPRPLATTLPPAWRTRPGPIRGNDTVGAVGVLAEGDAAMPIGIAYPVGLVEHHRGPAQTFRLVVNKTELPERRLCVGRRFVQSGEAAEEL